MAKIKIAELEIDDKALIKSTSDVKKAIDELKAAQKDLADQGDTNSKEYVKNASDLKILGSAYSSNMKTLSQMSQATQDAANKGELMSLVLKTEVTSITEARDQNKLLNKLRNDATTSLGEQSQEVKDLNAKLDSNNEFIKANGDAYLKQKINVGNYTDSIVDAYNEIFNNKKALVEEKNALEELKKEQEKGSEQWVYYNMQINQTNTQINVLNKSMGGLNDQANATASISKILSGDFKGLSEDAEAVGGSGNLLKSSLKGVGDGIISVTKSSLAFIATPVGLFVAGLVLVFALVKNAMNRSEESTNKITKVFSVFGAVASKLLKFLEPLGEFLIDGIVMGFELAGKAAETALNIVSGGLSLLGFDSAAKSVKGFKDEMKGAIIASQNLADAEAKLEKAQRESRKIQLDYQKQAEKLRQIRDDESKTIAERVKANEDLGAVLKVQLGEELKIAKLALLVANERMKADGKSKENIQAQAVALTTISDIEERITSQESEQLANRNSLRRDAAAKAKEIQDKAKEIQDKAIEATKVELDLFISQQGFKRKSLEDELILEEKVKDKKLAILKKEFDNKKITLLQFESESLAIKNDFLRIQAEITVENANIELENYKQKNKTLLDNNKFLSDALYLQELERLDALKQAEDEFQLTKLTEGVINLQEYDAAINATEEENRLRKEELAKQRSDADKEQKIIDLENERILADENFIAEAEIRSAQLEAKRLQEVENAEKTGADVNLINEKYAKAQKDIDKSVADFKMNSALDTFKMVAGLFGQQTVLGKAAALAEVGITTHKKAFESFAQAKVYFSNPATATLGVNAAIQGGLTIAGGAMTAAKIAGVKFEKGGIQEVGGKSHTQGGTKFYGEDGTTFEAQSGEGIGILNRAAYAGFMDFNNSFNGGKSGNGKFAGGGIITQGVRPNGDNIAQALQQLNIMVAVEDINRGQGSYAKVIEGANS